MVHYQFFNLAKQRHYTLFWRDSKCTETIVLFLFIWTIVTPLFTRNINAIKNYGSIVCIIVLQFNIWNRLLPAHQILDMVAKVNFSMYWFPYETKIETKSHTASLSSPASSTIYRAQFIKQKLWYSTWMPTVLWNRLEKKVV